MKRNALITAMFAFISLMSLANPFFSSKLQINVMEHGLYEFEVNGKHIHSANRSLHLDQLAPGEYNIRVFHTVHNNSRHYNRNLQRVLVFDDFIFINANTLTVGKLNRFGMEFRSSLLRSRNPSHHHPRNNPNICQASGIESHNQYIPMINSRQYQSLLHTIHETSFDNSRLQIAKTALRNNQMSTAQIAGIVRAFSFDSYRLEIAKYAFEACTDKESYYLISNEFRFDSTARELLASIQ
jgi:hypothetical protein